MRNYHKGTHVVRRLKASDRSECLDTRGRRMKDAWIRSARYVLMVLLGSALLISPRPAGAQPYEVPSTWGGDLRTRPRLTGSWGGLRDELGKKGVVLDMDVLLTPQSVLTGGKDTGAQFWGKANYTLNVDTGKLGLWPGGFIKISGCTSFGNHVLGGSGAIVPVNLAALVPTPKETDSALEGATFTQFLSTKFGLFAGKIATLDLAHGEFTGNYRTQFMNTGLAMPVALAMVPLSAFGGGIIVLPAKNVMLTSMVMDPNGTPTSNDLGKAFDHGVTTLSAGSLTIKPFGLVGHQSVTGVYSNKDRPSLIQDPSNLARLLMTEKFPRLGNSGPMLLQIIEQVYPNLLKPVKPLNRENTSWAIIYGFDQYLWQTSSDPKRGIGVFFNFGTSDGRANPIKYSYSMGIGGNGVVPGRPNDTFGIGWARTEFSDNFLRFLRDNLHLGLDHEDAIEIYYNASITEWLNVSPSLQVVNSALKKKLDSSGNLKDMDTAVVAGLRVYIRF